MNKKNFCSKSTSRKRWCFFKEGQKLIRGKTTSADVVIRQSSGKRSICATPVFLFLLFALGKVMSREEERAIFVCIPLVSLFRSLTAGLAIEKFSQAASKKKNVLELMSDNQNNGTDAQWPGG